MKVMLPHKIGGDLEGLEEGEEVCVRLDGTVEKNEDGNLILDLSEVSVEDYDKETDEEEKADEGGEYSDGDDEDDSKESKDRHAIIIGIVKKK